MATSIRQKLEEASLRRKAEVLDAPYSYGASRGSPALGETAPKKSNLAPADPSKRAAGGYSWLGGKLVETEGIGKPTPEAIAAGEQQKKLIAEERDRRRPKGRIANIFAGNTGLLSTPSVSRPQLLGY